MVFALVEALALFALIIALLLLFVFKMKGRIFLTFFLLVQTNWAIGAEGGGMPQLNPDSFSSQIFGYLSFSQYYSLACTFFFLPKIKNIRFRRNETIDTYLNETKELNQKTEDMIKMDNEVQS